MQYAANSSQQYAPRLPGNLHTPTQSFSEAHPALQTPDSHGADWADKQAKEHDSAKSRLSDPKFNISTAVLLVQFTVLGSSRRRDYADPLLPRQQTPSYYYPRGVTAEMETQLLDLIAKLKAQNA
ncbi:hypothetical protein F5Y01DRAFT_316064 [Xylaria sp. FL0043]|nr:hypothetical protein F5Y01DRAFT_316064 [Xylaria sp. FL0043]